MCAPALAAAGIASAAQYKMAVDQARFQQKVQDRNADVAYSQAVRSANTSNSALAARRQERAFADAEAKSRLTRESEKLRGQASLGGAGRSLGSVLTDLAAQQSNARAGIDRGYDFFSQQSDRDARQIQERARSRSLGQYSIPQPSLALPLISFASSAAVSSYIDKKFPLE
jgi:hypothetical protein